MAWIDDFVALHTEFESPLNFWRWAGLAAVSAILKDNVYVKQKMFNLYPNIYVMFHADSGLKKGPPVNAAKKLVKEVGNTKLISGRSSIQGILRKLGQEISKPGGKIDKGACAFICSSELSSSLVDDPAATDILTDLYDRSYNAGDWDSLLKGEEFSLKNATITMLTATNEAHSAEFLERKDVSGGFLARTFIIYESEENRPNSLIVVDDESVINYAHLAVYLKELAQLRGPFLPLGLMHETEQHVYEKKNKYTNQMEYFTRAGLIYEQWYEGFKEEVKGVKDPTGTLNRFGASVLKVAMLMSLSERPVLEISETGMTEAIKLCQRLVGNARKITFGRKEGDPSDGRRKKLLLFELISRPGREITRSEVMKKFWHEGAYNEWDDAVISMERADIVEIKQTEKDIVYKMKDKAYEEIKAMLDGRVDVSSSNGQ